MRFLMIYHPDHAAVTAPPTQELMTAMGKLVEESTKAGILISTGGTCGLSYGIRVRRQDGEVSVHDGPFTEAKELVGGYALCELPSKEAAIAYAKKFLAIVGNGDSEIHQLDS